MGPAVTLNHVLHTQRNGQCHRRGGCQAMIVAMLVRAVRLQTHVDPVCDGPCPASPSVGRVAKPSLG